MYRVMFILFVHNSIKFGYWTFKSIANLDEAILLRGRQNVFSKKLITAKML